MSKKINKKGMVITRSLLALAIISIGLILFKVICSDKTEAKEKTAKENVRVLAGNPVKLQPFRLTTSAFAVAKAVNHTTVSAEVKGKIIYLNSSINNGSIVRKGEIIAKIDSENYKTALEIKSAKVSELKNSIEQQKFSVESSEILASSSGKQYELEKIQYNRSIELEEKHIISPAVLEQNEQQLEEIRMNYYKAVNAEKYAKIKLDILYSQFKAATASEKQAEINLQKCIITSPFRGRITKLNIDKAEYVTPGTKLFDLIDNSSLEIPITLSKNRFYLLFRSTESNTNRHWFDISKKISVTIHWNDNIHSYESSGKIIDVSGFNSNTQTISLLVQPKETNSETGSFPLVAGMFCEVTFRGRKIEHVIKVSLNSIQQDNSIYVVGSDNRVKEKKINVIAYTSDAAVISFKGLTENDKIVEQQLPQGLTNGTKVKIVKPLST
ncbi:MAG TPA: hypothetical protein QF753_10300 [Victivallales bacterium]|nr:hypothetical protein [Victivallales bacterium]